MEYGIFVTPNPRAVAEEARLAEDLGFTHAWFPDDPMLGGGDLFACMALAATATRTIKLCAGIAAAPNRSAPVTANAIATINALAPGRVVLGYGSGSATRATLGLPPLTVGAVRRQLTTLQGLLRDGEGAYESGGCRTTVRFFNRGLEFTKLAPRIPTLVAAAAPKMAALAGELADGLIYFGPAVPELAAQLLGHIRAGARRAGRDARELQCVWVPLLCVLGPGETLDSARVVQRTGSGVLSMLKALSGLALGAGDVRFDTVPPVLRPAVRAYAAQFTGVPKDQLHLKLWESQYTLPPSERQFVTPDTIRATFLIGNRDEVLAQLEGMTAVGVTQIAVFGCFDNFRAAATEVSRELIRRS
jgi:alkanesulfonate monooxygenase SsuD/methylene tetrahydromethanopterin reductase-like flavin-dependent oxidoreductase (luciferase family)